MPWYLLRKPSKAYYASHIVIPNFVVCDISKAENRVLIYDERGQMKDAEALTSLRMYFHLTDVDKDRNLNRNRPSFLFQVMDNCVGQNKSHVVFMFYALLSMTLFPSGVALLYLVGGHSHLCNDRVTGQAKRSLQGKDIFSPEGFVDNINQSKGIDCELLSYTDTTRPMWTGFSNLFKKHFKDLPANNAPGGYTKHHFFEFSNGILSVRDRVGSDVIYTHDYLNGVVDRFGVIHKLQDELLGPGKSFSDATISDIKLPRAPVRSLTDDKIASIGTLMHLIPQESRDYYPKLTKQAEAIMKKQDEFIMKQLASSKSSKKAKVRTIILTPGILHGRLQKSIASSDRSSSNKKLYGALPTKVDDIKVESMKNFLMIDSVGSTRMDTSTSQSNKSRELGRTNELPQENTDRGKSRKEKSKFTLSYYISFFRDST